VRELVGAARGGPSLELDPAQNPLRPAEIPDRIDSALVASEPDGMALVRKAVNLLTDALVSHLSYEERQLVEPLARLGHG
jgi:hypothetical protein